MTSPICLGMHTYCRIWRGIKGKIAFPLMPWCLAGSYLLRGRLHEMEVRRPPGTETRVDPVPHDLGVRDDLVCEPEERDVGEFLEQMVGDRPGMALPFLGFYGLGPGPGGAVDH